MKHFAMDLAFKLRHMNDSNKGDTQEQMSDENITYKISYVIEGGHPGLSSTRTNIPSLEITSHLMGTPMLLLMCKSSCRLLAILAFCTHAKDQTLD